jgi:hypothetical protein
MRWAFARAVAALLLSGALILTAPHALLFVIAALLLLSLDRSGPMADVVAGALLRASNDIAPGDYLLVSRPQNAITAASTAVASGIVCEVGLLHTSLITVDKEDTSSSLPNRLLVGGGLVVLRERKPPAKSTGAPPSMSPWASWTEHIG